MWTVRATRHSLMHWGSKELYPTVALLYDRDDTLGTLIENRI
jgi:hypothetical protein